MLGSGCCARKSTTRAATLERGSARCSMRTGMASAAPVEATIHGAEPGVRAAGPEGSCEERDPLGARASPSRRWAAARTTFWRWATRSASHAGLARTGSARPPAREGPPPCQVPASTWRATRARSSPSTGHEDARGHQHHRRLIGAERLPGGLQSRAPMPVRLSTAWSRSGSSRRRRLATSARTIPAAFRTGAAGAASCVSAPAGSVAGAGAPDPGGRSSPPLPPEPLLDPARAPLGSLWKRSARQTLQKALGGSPFVGRDSGTG